MDTYSPSYSINKPHIYHVSKHSSSHYGSLIDREANGGLAGSDVRILERTGRTISVTGIDNHELPGLDIGTCAALLHTNHGKVVLIMHEHAYYGRGNTIHSPGQIKWFQNTCDDKSFHVGVKQVIAAEVCYLLEVSWQMCHAWITHWTVVRDPLTMSRLHYTWSHLL